MAPRFSDMPLYTVKFAARGREEGQRRCRLKLSIYTSFTSLPSRAQGLGFVQYTWRFMGTCKSGYKQRNYDYDYTPCVGFGLLMTLRSAVRTRACAAATTCQGVSWNVLSGFRV